MCQGCECSPENTEHCCAALCPRRKLRSVGYDWTVSDKTKEAIKGIDDNIRNAAIKAGSIIVGQTNGEQK